MSMFHKDKSAEAEAVNPDPLGVGEDFVLHFDDSDESAKKGTVAEDGLSSSAYFNTLSHGEEYDENFPTARRP